MCGMKDGWKYQQDYAENKCSTGKRQRRKLF